ncbi:hypothetical protein [Lentibacillus salicampi]|uniref:Uncharacterized protein n=1 Tax=Lentibacillus salicampi TaxID=175306 RepID=A0A4Y9ABD7_9BACI|nr:hypothetical protein [Lentibacillus salicampi]TFJ93229.1 hypothetical protein E4U82_07780 [Lentibacillus salicampi]
MKKESLGKIKSGLLIVISLALIITGIQLYQEKQENNRQFELFLNHFYFELTDIIRSLNAVLKEPMEGKELEHALLAVKDGLERTDFMLEAGSDFADRDIHAHPSFFSNHPLGQFSDDGMLASEEADYLEDLKNDLDTIRSGLHSDESGQENPDLSIRAFNNIINGSGYESGFLTEHKSITLPFQIVDPEQVPEPIRKWIEQSASEDQKKVFHVDGRMYVLIIPEQAGKYQAVITDMTRAGGGIAVTHKIKEQSGDTAQESAMAIAALEMKKARPFQFTTQLESDEESGNTGNSNAQRVQAGAVAELVPPEKISEDGQVVE